MNIRMMQCICLSYRAMLPSVCPLFVIVWLTCMMINYALPTFDKEFIIT